MVFKTLKHSIEKEYKITEQVLGKGKDGNILLIIEKASGNKYALKMLKINQINRDQIIFQKHASQMTDSVVKIKNVYEDPDISDYYLVVMEYLEGSNLNDRIKSRHLKENESVEIVRQIVKALAKIHSIGIVHGDLRTENILFTSKQSNQIKITDFGNAALTKLDKIDFKKVKKFDSIIHVAPELVGQNEYNYTHHDLSSDIWSIGVLAFILLNNLSPFYLIDGKKNSSEMREMIKQGTFRYDYMNENKHVSDDSKKFVYSCMKLDPSTRPSITKINQSKWLMSH